MGFRPCKRKGNGVGTMGGWALSCRGHQARPPASVPTIGLPGALPLPKREKGNGASRKELWTQADGVSNLVTPWPGCAALGRFLHPSPIRWDGNSACFVVRLTHTFTCKVRVVSAHPGWVFTLWVGEDVPGQEGWAGWRPDSDPRPCTPFSTSAFPTMRQSPPGTGLE